MDTDYDRIHVLGSSLGAQAAGYVGFFTGGAISRITGLDPSGPLFYSVTNEDRLDKTDARFVDIYHTAGYWVGSTRPDGHVDVWPNGGLAPQPGCTGKESLDLSCSHFKAWRMFAESIAATRKGNNALPFVGKKIEYKFNHDNLEQVQNVITTKSFFLEDVVTSILNFLNSVTQSTPPLEDTTFC